MTDEEYQIRRKYENRNLMQELEWVSHYPPSGMSNQDRAFIRWLAMTAYDKINELEQTSVPVHDIELILDEAAKPQWISVTDRLPEIGETVFVLAYGYDAFTAKMLDQIEYGYPVFECSGFFRELAKPGRITHWMPLPVPPKEET